MVQMTYFWNKSQIIIYKMDDNKKLEEFLNSSPLYKKLSLEHEYCRHANDLDEFTFSFHCPNENAQQTFKLQLEPNRVLSSLNKDYRPQLEYWNDEQKKISFIQHYTGVCQHCQKFRIHFLIKCESEGTVKISNAGNSKQPNISVMKIGQFPPFKINADKNITEFLNDEDKENYNKALICRSQNYGIGAFAYLRRIVEKEIIRIIESLSQLDRPESKEIKRLIEQYNKDHQMSKLIDAIFEFLPGSLKSLGDNPLKLLYNELSEGIHDFSEEECSNKAESIDKLLSFVIKKINEENSEVKEAMEAIKALKGEGK